MSENVKKRGTGETGKARNQCVKGASGRKASWTALSYREQQLGAQVTQTTGISRKGM